MKDDGISESHPSKNQLRFGGDGDADDSDDNDDADDSDSTSLSLKCHSTSNRKEDGSDDSDSMSLNKKPASNSTKNKKSVKRAKLDIFSPMYGDAGKRSSTSAKSRTSKESKAEEGGSVKSPASKERWGASAMSGAGGGAMPPSSTTRSGDGNNSFEVINLEDEVRSDEGNSIKNNPFEVINLADEVSSDEGNKIFSVYTQVKDESDLIEYADLDEKLHPLGTPGEMHFDFDVRMSASDADGLIKDLGDGGVSIYLFQTTLRYIQLRRSYQG